MEHHSKSEKRRERKRNSPGAQISSKRAKSKLRKPKSRIPFLPRSRKLMEPPPPESQPPHDNRSLSREEPMLRSKESGPATQISPLSLRRSLPREMPTLVQEFLGSILSLVTSRDLSWLIENHHYQPNTFFRETTWAVRVIRAGHPP